jgi:hypothetical protein
MTLTSPVLSKPAIGDGVVYFATTGGYVYALQSATGAVDVRTTWLWHRM